MGGALAEHLEHPDGRSGGMARVVPEVVTREEHPDHLQHQQW